MSDEKKISLGEIEDLLEEGQDGKSTSWFSLSNLFAVLVLNWQWFLLSLIIFVCGAFIYLRYAEPVHKISARMLIKDEQKSKNPAQMLHLV